MLLSKKNEKNWIKIDYTIDFWKIDLYISLEYSTTSDCIMGTSGEYHYSFKRCVNQSRVSWRTTTDTISHLIDKAIITISTENINIFFFINLSPIEGMSDFLNPLLAQILNGRTKSDSNASFIVARNFCGANIERKIRIYLAAVNESLL